MVKIAVVVGSTRPGRNGAAVARWVHDLAGKRTDAQFELVDIATYELPLLDEPVPPSMGQYGKEHTQRWGAKVAEFDGYVFVTPEYNHGPSGALKNALDYIYAEWHNKAAGLVSLGSSGGVRAAEHLRAVAADLEGRRRPVIGDDRQHLPFLEREPVPARAQIGIRQRQRVAEHDEAIR